MSLDTIITQGIYVHLSQVIADIISRLQPLS